MCSSTGEATARRHNGKSIAARPSAIARGSDRGRGPRLEGIGSVSLILGEVQFELESPAIIAAGSRGTSLVRPGVRRALYDGRIRTLGVVACAAGIAVGFQGVSLSAAWNAILLAAAWAVGIHAVEHSLRTVRVAAGRVGGAILSAGTGPRSRAPRRSGSCQAFRAGSSSSRWRF